ncbi:MAG TPA: hypothetical protein VH682_26655 [Gemmataceae bacterium]
MMWVPWQWGALAAAFLILGGCARVASPAPEKESDDEPLPAVAIDPAAYARSVEAVKKLGGRVEITDAKRGIPGGVSVDFLRVQIRDEDLSVLAGLTALRELEIYDTPITGVGLKHLADLPLLRKLELTVGHDLTDAGFQELSRLTQVRSLDLTFTAVSDARLKLLADMKKLRKLRIDPGSREGGEARGEPVTDEGLKAVMRLTDLRVLALKWVPVNDARVKDLAGLPELRELDLSSTEVTDAVFKTLMDFRKLRKLNLVGKVKVTGTGLGQLAKLPELRSLEISVTAAGLKELPRLTQLEELRVSSRNLTNDAVRSLAALKGLRTLVIKHAVVYAILDGVQDLQRELPGCTIKVD